MNCILKDAKVYIDGKFTQQDVYIADGTLFLEYTPLFSDATTISFKINIFFPVSLMFTYI